MIKFCLTTAIKFVLFSCYSLCFGLTETGKLIVLCMHTLMPIFVWDDLHVVDFTLLDGLDAENNLLIMTGGETHNMFLMSWPGKVLIILFEFSFYEKFVIVYLYNY